MTMPAAGGAAWAGECFPVGGVRAGLVALAAVTTAFQCQRQVRDGRVRRLARAQGRSLR